MARRFWKSRKLWGPIVFGLVVATIAATIYVVHLDRVVTHQFEGRRWTLPAQVYAAPIELYAGLRLPPSEIENELQRLEYRRMTELSRPGSYRRRGARIDVALRAARFVDEERPSQILTIEAGPNGITSLRDSRGTELPIVRLEPLLIGSIFPIHGEDRIVVTPDEVPPLLPAALKAVEDRKFDTHFGIDPLGILRAVWVNLRAGQVEQGASTLVQQLVRSYFLDSRQTLGRKLREALMAIALDARFSKTDLMNAYINEIFLGQDGRRAIHGFGLASQFYFGKPLGELDLAEVALLVTVARGPSYYDPRRHPERARARRDLVLQILASRGVVKAEEARAAAKRPLGVTARASGGYFPAYLDFVRRTLRRDYRDEDLTESGLRVFTSLDPRVQERAERTLEQELTRLDRARKKKGATLEGSVVVTLPQSGDVIAIVGSRRVGYDGFNRALDAHRPIGSLVKPFIYLTALETGQYNPATIIDDTPVDLRLPTGQHWRPENFTHDIHGPVPMVRALTESLNLATVNLGLDIGVPKVIDTLQRFGLERKPQPLPSLLLGAVDAAPIEVAQLYNGLANGGFRTPLRAVRAVIGHDGKELKAFPVQITPIADDEAIYQLDRMMEQVMIRGTGASSRRVLPPSLVVAGKSGTSSDLRDSWFAGFSGSHLAVVWVGFDDNKPTGLTGSAGALPVWSRLMAGVQPSSLSAPMPESLREIQIDFATGMQATSACADEVISVPVPLESRIPYKPGCAPGVVGPVIQRATEFLRGIIPR